MTDKEDGISVDKLVRAYIKMREKREELTRDLRHRSTKSISEKMRLVKNDLLDQMRSANVESIRTTEGFGATAPIDKKYWTSDWDNFLQLHHGAQHPAGAREAGAPKLI